MTTPIDREEVLYQLERLALEAQLTNEHDAEIIKECMATIANLVPVLTPPNEPLTLELLKELDGVNALWVHELVWDIHKPRLMLVRKITDGFWSCCDFDGFLTFAESEYGNGFIIYRFLPEGEEDGR